MSKTHQGFLLISDITGYTQYLTESELEHAQETLTALLKLLVENTRPPLVISRLAGDAVISYGLQEHFFQGQTFIDKIENLYIAFRKTVELLVLNNTCQCNACANISNLDLKFFCHYGTFGIQRIADHNELVGSDINLLHRLLKNHVTEQTGFRGYTLCTDAVIQQLALDGLQESMTPLTESYEHLGDVRVWVMDLHPVWKARKDEVAVAFPQEDLLYENTVDIDLPRELVWSYLTHPDYRKIITGSDKIEITNKEHGRTGTGSVYQCYHGDMVIPHTILAWHPFERYLTQEIFPMIQATTYFNEYRLDPVETGTRLTLKTSKASGPFLGRVLFWGVVLMTGSLGKKQLATFKQQVETDSQLHAQEQADEIA